MASTITAAAQLNGNGIAPEAEAEFLDKLLRLRDEVLAGKHPRIKLPPAALEQLARATAPKPIPTPASRPTTNGTSISNQHVPLLPPRPDSSLQQQQQHQQQPQTPHEHNNHAAHVSRPFSAKSASSGIDPVLLTKSDHLIKAELQLKRQQIERVVKDQLDKKGRASDALAEETFFDVEDALAKAQALVKPLSGLRPPAPKSDDASSFDENSYYSSKANSWSSEEVDSNQTAHSVNAVDPLTSQSNASPPAQLTASKAAGVPLQNAQPAIIDLDEEPYEPAEDIEIYEPERAQVVEEQEESDYSPPPAAAGPSEPNRGRQRDRQGAGRSNGSSRRQSPAGNAAPIQNPRKRRREERRQARQQANKRVARSPETLINPEPYIKEEPQSPPPFGSYPDAQPNKRRALQPFANDDELVSVRDGRMQPAYYREQDDSPRSFRPYEEPMSPTVIHMPQRRVGADQDLRRVASLQSMRRPYSPGAVEQYHALEPRQLRSASHAYVNSPIEPVYREVSALPSATPRYVRDRSRSPVQEYLPRARSPVLMAPPARRIVMDQYGNRFYATAADLRESVPPPRRVEVDPYYERAVTREPTMRAPARPAMYEEDSMMMMPPPPPRRYVEASDADFVEPRQYRQREPSHRPMEVEYAPRGVVERRPMIQYEEMGPPREYAPRAYSVRPEMIRREQPEEYAPLRHESVAPRYVSVAAPRYREVSVVHQEPHAFAMPTHGRRFVEDGAPERPVEVAQEPYSGEPRRMRY